MNQMLLFATSSKMDNTFMNRNSSHPLIVFTALLLFLISGAVRAQGERTPPPDPKSGEQRALAAGIEARVTNSSGYLRSTVIDRVPSSERGRFMRFLDAGRAAADAGMHLIAVGRFDDFYKSTSESFKSRYSPEQFDLLAKLLKESVGAIVSYEYRNQAIEYPAGSPLSSDLSKATSNTFFNLKLSKGGGGGIFMDIETTVEDGKHVISFITTNNYGSNVPPWLSRR